MADATTFTVTNTNAAGPGSLDAAITQANTNPGLDTVNFMPAVAGTITLAGNVQVTDSVDIVGPGAGTLTVTDPVGVAFDFSAATTQQSSISGLSVENSMGGIYADDQSALTVSDSVVSGNNLPGSEGGIYAYGASLTVIGSTVSGNADDAYAGGGIRTYGPTTIQDSTISGNTIAAGQTSGGGGIRAYGSLTVQDSTVFGNTGSYGGGISADGALTLTDSTVSGNSGTGAQGGGGIYDRATTPHGQLQDTIVSGNTAAKNPDLSGTFDSAFSLIQSPGTATISQTVAGSDILNQDPLLGPLQDNGGPTQTLLPSPSSPAVNKGMAFGPSTDQRGLARPAAFPGVANSAAAGADGSDIGAVELQVALAVTGAASVVGSSVATLNGSVNPENRPTAYHFEYGTTLAYGTSTVSQSAGSDGSAHAVLAPLAGLAPSTKYHFRVVATNADGATSTGADMTFTTATAAPAPGPPSAPTPGPVAPVVTTGPANSITPDAATVTGSVNPDGLITTYAFQYGRSSAYGQQSVTTTLPAGLTAVAVSAALHGLHQGQTYHYRLVANNAAGTTDGLDMTFRSAQLPRTSVLGVSQHACVASTVLARVTISDAGRPERVVVTLDGREVLRTTHATFSIRVPVGHLAAGRHTVRITGIASNGAHFSRMVHFSRCAVAGVHSPPFTG